LEATVNKLLIIASLIASPAFAEDAPWTPKSIGFLVLEGVYNTELVAPLDVMQHVVGRVESEPKVFTVGITKDPVRTAEGLRILPDYSLADAPEIDILVVASTTGSRDRDRKNRELVAWVAERGKKARHVMSLCWGAFLLAEAGLLDGGPATTFPTEWDQMEREYPDIDVQRDHSFVDAGHALTSVGGVKSYEIAMYLVENLYGKAVTAGIADGLLIDWDIDELVYVKAE
jgi:transcriptional regulator GlxA family with amidase domain